jgi:hypothetical protein
LSRKPELNLAVIRIAASEPPVTRSHIAPPPRPGLQFEKLDGIHPRQGIAMRISRPVLGGGAAMALLGIFGAKVIAVADDKSAGEMWHRTMSMEMAGMTMPPRTIDVCVPPGKAQEQLSKPQTGHGG